MQTTGFAISFENLFVELEGPKHKLLVVAERLFHKGTEFIERCDFCDAGGHLRLNLQDKQRPNSALGLAFDNVLIGETRLSNSARGRSRIATDWPKPLASN